MVAKRTVVSITVLAVVVACGGGSDSKVTAPKTPTTGNRTMTARLDGSAWTATNVAVSSTNGLLIVAGAQGTGAAIGISASLVQGTGTQTVGRTSVAGGTVTVGSAQWAASAAQGTGTVALTLVSATRAAGTFTFTAPAVTTGASPGTRSVTSGAFDVTF